MSGGCFVPGCSHTQRKNPNLNFFSVTNEREIKEKWLEAIEKGTGCLLDSKILDDPDTRICSSHFELDNQNIQDGSHAIPTVFKAVSFYMDDETLAKCRICLKAQGMEELTLQDTLPKSRISIADAVKKSFNIDLNLYPHFPQSICARCYNLVVASYVLKLEILKTDAALRRMSQDINNEMFEKLLNNPALTITKKSSNFVIKEVQHTVSVIPKVREKIVEEDTDEEDVEEEEEEEDDVEMKDETIDDTAESSVIAIEDEEKSIDVKVQKETFENWLDETQKDSIKHEGKSRVDKFRVHKCKKCQFEGKRLLELLRHIDDSSEGCSELYNPTKTCYICRKKFMLFTMKIKHIERDHEDLENTDCTHCEAKNFGSVVLFEKHLRDHFEPPEFGCTKCDKKFYKIENLRSHMDQHAEASFFCDQCNYEANNIESMTMHMNVHSDF